MPIDFQPDNTIDFEPDEDSLDPYFRQAHSVLENTGAALASGVGHVSNFLDKYSPWGAPARAAIGAAQEGKPIFQAYTQQYGEDPSLAPSGKDIAAKAGISAKEFDLPIIKNPYTMERYKASPAGIVGAVGETAIDPTTYVGFGPAKGAAMVGEKLAEAAPAMSRAARNFARERAVKAATGENIRAIKRLAKAEGPGAKDARRAMANIQKTGGQLLAPDPNFQNKSAVGWLSNAQDIGEAAARRQDFYGDRIGQVGPLVDKYAPGAITPQMLAEDVAAYGKEIPMAGQGAPVRKRVAEEAEMLRNFGLDEGQLGPAAPLPFKVAQNMKRDVYPFSPKSQDALLSNRQSTNKINRIISDRMDKAAELARAKATGEELPILKGYGDDKKMYNLYTNVADAGAEQGLRTLGRRMVSPSSNFLGATAGNAAAQVKNDLAQGGLWGAGVGLVNQQLLERGSAFGAKAANAISGKIRRSPQLYQKWLPTMQKAAVAGPAALVATHRQLMNNDPEYRRLMFEQEGEP